jgi:prepilin-type N-terminal cleavage/methylation domain-containing protein
MNKFIKGFTLMELLIVVAIIGILSTVMVVAVNPGRQMAKARDSQRKTDLVAILSGVMQYASEHSGDLPDTDGDPDTSNFPTSPTCIGSAVGCFDLANAGETGDEIVPVYMVSMPHDPRFADETDPQLDTGYMIYADENGRLHASATGEVESSIAVSR